MFEKDLRLELRNRYATNTLLLFLLGTILILYFGLGARPAEARVQAALLWVVLLFSAAVGLGRGFVAEEERGTTLLLRLHVRGSMVYAGKVAFTFVLVAALNAAALGAFFLLLGLRPAAPGLLVVALGLGGLGLSAATAFLAALIARTSGSATLLPVLLFPVLVPLLLASVSASQAALEAGPSGGWAAAAQDLWTLVGFDGVVITAALLLFDYVWND